ncbi:MAG TPA: gluconate 2-dehydrogenase subunit 3 family protein [Terriglobia bacterium]|nr:gluconate 2-dehydrogenase subunit 3 family protein [Terriglobia bacterium]
MERRTALKIVALSALAPVGITGPAGTTLEGTAWTPGSYRLRFFNEQEIELLDNLMEMIIPADDHSPGARAAQVSLFADLMVATSDNHLKEVWRSGLQLMRHEASRSSLQAALARSAVNEGNPKNDLERFYGHLKEMTINGYYTSAIGIHHDLQYQGNTYLQRFPGTSEP